MKKIFIFDTNVILSDPNCLYSYGTNDVGIPIKVIEEIDNFKSKMDTTGFNARTFVRHLDTLKNAGDILKGVRIAKGLGKLFIINYSNESLSNDDDVIIESIVHLKKTIEKPTIFVSNDILARIKAQIKDIKSIEHSNSEIKSKNELYSGFYTMQVENSLIDKFYSGEPLYFDPEKYKLFPNQFVLMKTEDGQQSALCRFVNFSSPVKKIPKIKGDWVILPKNKEQTLTYDLLFEKDIDLVTLSGPSGVGKTLLALAAGLEQVNSGQFKKVVVTKPIVPIGNDIGYLPGSLKDKLLPWSSPIIDNVKYIIGGDKTKLEELLDNGTLELDAITFMRGRSISDSFIIIDEAQNLNVNEIKTMLTRVGQNSKIVLTGDIEQIDSVYLNEVTNGLTITIEKFKNCEFAGHITLIKGVRSRLATMASKVF